MKKVLGAAAGVVALVGTYGAGKLYIDADGGGSVAGYVQRYNDLYNDNVRVVVRGACYSSCTMALGFPNSCLMPDAVLGFHPAYVPILFGMFSYKIHPAATQTMRDHYPPDALAIINQHHGLRDNGGWMYPRLVFIPAKDFPARYQC